MRHGQLIFATAVALLTGACVETDAEAARRRSEAAQAAQTEQLAGALPPEASCRRSILKNPYFGIADPAPIAGIPGAIPHSIAGGPQAMWAWRSASDQSPRWQRLEVPSAVYLAAGQAISQADLDLPAGQWRLVVGAAMTGDRPAGLRMELEGDPGAPFEIEALGPPTLHVAEINLSEGADRLILTGLGPGEVKLVMACLSPMEAGRPPS